MGTEPMAVEDRSKKKLISVAIRNAKKFLPRGNSRLLRPHEVRRRAAPLRISPRPLDIVVHPCELGNIRIEEKVPGSLSGIFVGEITHSCLAGPDVPSISLAARLFRLRMFC
jgi:hypothetical protein